MDVSDQKCTLLFFTTMNESLEHGNILTGNMFYILWGDILLDYLDSIHNSIFSN